MKAHFIIRQMRCIVCRPLQNHFGASMVWCIVIAMSLAVSTTAKTPASDAPWVADLGDGAYKNPILYSDYSDPDVIRVGDDFYMTASSFNCVPALPLLHSRDLVNWELIGHAAERLSDRYDTVQHGNGIWAPSLRYRDGYFWIFVGDPDIGILMTRSQDPAGPWEPLHVVKAGKGLIDPCPLWDGDKAYLVHAYAKSRAGKNSILDCWQLSTDGRRLIGEPHLVVDGRNGVHPTIEGPKFYKRNGWYYIFAPAGGVKPGWQLAARSRKPFGPYEVRRVLEQGSTDINGPHQGGWVELPNGESWFVHFQDRGAYGRVVHLNPVQWIDDWPVMGVDRDGNGVGEPVKLYKKPDVGAVYPITAPATSDRFGDELGYQWQWQGNPRPNWWSLSDRPGWLRLYAVPPQSENMTAAANQLLQKLPAPEFVATTRLELSSTEEARAGLVVMGQDYAGLMAQEVNGDVRVEWISSKQSPAEKVAQPQASVSGLEEPLWLRVSVEPGAVCTFSYSIDGQVFSELGEPFTATPGRWMGAKVGLVCLGDNGYADFDWFRVE